MFDHQTWAAAPFHFWSAVFFVFGAIVGSLLNVCIHRMPRGESIVSPPSHCPHCGCAIPWYLNLPVITWIVLRGRCANCGARISVRYLIVEALTGLAFLGCWLAFGHRSASLALVYCLLLAGFVVATFIDIEHFIIPDEITFGGIVLGFLCSAVVPAMHADFKSGVVPGAVLALKQSAAGIAVGAGTIYAILRLGKVLFGRQTFTFEPGTKLIFTETSLQLPGHEIPFCEMFYRPSDSITLTAKTVELPDRCYANVPIRLTASSLQIGEDQFNPEEITHMEVMTDEIVVPREAMGLGDVKFMAAIGAFLGWQAIFFSLMCSAVLGSLVGVTLIALRKQAWSSRLPYGPYIALAATIWIFGGKQLAAWWFSR